MTTGDERLAEIIRAYEAQNEEWARAKEQLAALGDVGVAVPDRLFDTIDDACMVHVPVGSTCELGIRA